MKTPVRFFYSIPGVAVLTALVLSIPLIAMQVTTEVQWRAGDFLIMGMLLFSTGSAFVVITRNLPSLIQRVAFAAALATTLMLVWVNLAVGLIGSGAHAGNLMYVAVVAVVLIGTSVSRFAARGMALTMFAAALTLAIIGAIALLANMQTYPGSSVAEILAVNTCFAFLYAVTGLLFRCAGVPPVPEQPPV
ncbi:MAG: hypothetical protein J0L66_00485 [Cytophagales bacterium]|nr:hypothetical protein [Cytophagales bacterium]